MAQKELTAKLVLLGESAVGKSSIVLRFVRQEFVEYQDSTIGAAFLTQSVNLGQGPTIRFEIWDTAGQERYRSLAPMYYRNAVAAIIVYDVTSQESFKRAKSWLNELRSQTDPGSMKFMLCANKTDLSSQRTVPTSQGQAFAAEEEIPFIETSAKTGSNVDEMFVQIAKVVAATKAASKDVRSPNNASMLRSKSQPKKKEGCC